MKRIISYNVNGIRAAIKKGFLEWLTAVDADIICLQETKAQPEQIPIFEFEALGYRSYWFSAQKKVIAALLYLRRKLLCMLNTGWGLKNMMMKAGLFVPILRISVW